MPYDFSISFLGSELSENLNFVSVKVHNVSTDPLTRVEENVGLAGQVVANGAHAHAVNNLISGFKVAERHRQRAASYCRHVCGVVDLVAKQRSAVESTIQDWLEDKARSAIHQRHDAGDRLPADQELRTG